MLSRGDVIDKSEARCIGLRVFLTVLLHVIIPGHCRIIAEKIMDLNSFDA